MIQKLLLFVRSLFYYFFNSSKERSLTPSLRLLCLGMFFVVSFANAATITSTAAGGNWGTNGSWVGGNVPANGDTVVIVSTATINTNGTNRICAGITINGNLTMANGDALTVNGNVSGTGIWTTGGGTRTISLTGDWSFSGVSTGSGATVVFNGTGNQNLTGRISSSNVGTLIISKTGGSVTMGNLINVATFTNTAGTFDASTYLLTVSGTTTLTAGTLRAGASTWGGNYSFTPTPPTSFTIDYYNATPTINAVITYQNLTFSGTGTTNNPSGNLTIQGNLVNSSSGILNFSARNIILSGTATQSIAGFTTTGTVSMTKTGGIATLTGNVNGGGLIINGSGGTLHLGSGLTHTFTGNWTRTNGTLNGGSSTFKIAGDISGTGGTFTANTGTVEFDKGGAQSLGTTALTFNNLTLSNSGTKTLGAATVVTADLSIAGGVTLTTNNFDLTIGGNFTSSGTFTPGTATVNLNGTNQSFNVSNFYNLTLSGSGTKTFASTGATAVSNNLIINSGVNANLGTQTHTANSLTLGSSQVLPSSWGSSSSTALNKSNMYFTATSGKINVAVSSCTNFSAVAQIISVSLNNSIKTSTGTTNYEDFTSPVLTTVVKGQSYALTVRGNTNGDQNVYYSAFFDWNNDGDFDDVGEYSQIGTIRNSVGTSADGRAASAYILFPSGAFTGTIKMRIIGRLIGYNNTPCVIAGSTGQMEDYSITLQAPCGGNLNPGNTVTSSSSVCPSTPFYLSFDTTVADGVTYTWQTSPNIGGPFTDAAPAPANFFGTETFNSLPANTDVYGSANVTGGQLVLTTAINSQQGAYIIHTTPTTNVDVFTVNFDYQIPTGGTGADGFSLSYSDNLGNDAGGGESGEGAGIIVQFDTFDNEGVTAGSRIRVQYAGNTLYNSAIDAPILRPTTGNTPVVLKVDAKGKLTLIVNGVTAVSDLVLPAGYLAATKTNWNFKFSGRTGGSNDKHIIDNLLIRYLDITNSGPTFTTSQIAKTYYRVKVSCGGGDTYSIPVVVNMTSASITPMTASTCSLTAFTALPIDVTNGTVPTGTTYTWLAPALQSGLTGGAASSGAQNNISDNTLSNTTAGSLTATYTVTPTTAGCTGPTFTVIVTVNPSPSLATATQATAVCAGSTAVINLTGLLPSSTSTIAYTINGTAQTAITGVAAGVTGLAIFTTPALTAANNGQILQITGITITSTTPNCNKSFTTNVTLSVNPTPTLIGATQSATPVCVGSAATINLTGLLAGSTSTISYTINSVAQTSITGLVANGSGAASFTTPALTAANDGQTLQITGITATSATPNCGQSFATNITLSVNPLPTITTSNTPAVVTSVCASVIAQSTDLVYTSSTANGTSYSIDWATLTDQASTPYAFAVGAGSITGINVPAGTTAGTYNGAMTISNANCSSTINITLIVKPLLVAPVPGIPVQPTCGTQTGSVTLTGLPGSGTLLENDGTTIVSHAISSTSLTVVGLVPGTYRFAIDNGCTLTYSGNIVIQANTWNGASWSYGTDPSHNDLVDFRGNYNLVKNIDACSCTVSNGAIVTIASGKTLDVVNGVHVVSGSLTFEDSASLMQTSTSNSLNSGNITYIRNSADIRQSDYVYWSTPVKGQTLAGVSKNLTGDDYYFGYDGTQWVFTPKTTVMTVGKGYIIRGPDTFSNSARTPFSASFIGIPNNGNINGEAVVANNFYLIGNPYPSALDADAFILANTALLQGTLSFWTHNTPVDLSGAAYEYKSDDYATYNLSGGTSTRIGAGSGNSASGNNPDTPSGKIGAGQSFFAKVVGSGTITFNNLMRSGGNTNGQFFKPGKTSKTTALEKHRVWLDLTNAGGAFKQMLVGYIEGATNATEKMYDGVSMDGNKYIDFYSINEGENLVIQGRALPFADTDVVPLGYRTTVAGDFTISLDQADGVLSTQAVYLEDKTTGIIHDLRAGNYTYTTAVGTFENRFVLRYTNKTLGTGDFENIENGIVVSVKDKAIKVLSSKETIKEVTVFDVTGKLLYDKKKVGATELQITTLQAGNQVLLVEVTLENGYKTAKKIIFQ